MEAPGGPGAPPMWGPGRKMAFGAAPGPRSKLWYMLADGPLSEVFFPTIDRVALPELRFFASASGAPPVDDAGDGQHRISWFAPGTPGFIVDSTHHEYRLTKEYFSDPEENALLIAATFTPELPDVRLYVQASAHWQPGSEGNFGQVLDTHPPALLMRQQDVWICIVGPFSKANIGYFQSSDLQVDLHDGDGHLTNLYDRAGPGNVAVGAELGIRAGAFQMAIGFAHSRADAEEVARHVLQKGAGNVRYAFERAWHSQTDLPQALSKVSGDEGMLARSSLAVLRCLEDKSHAGAFIAAPCSPWGESNHNGNHVYHLVWPRDLCRISTALLDAGDTAAALPAVPRADGQYVRLAGDPDIRPTVGAIAPEFLEMVRYGLRRPKDERILRSLQGVDALLKVSLPAGPSWRRYVGDLYGEKDDGSPWDGSGRGRAWPVLTGERARHFFSMGLPAAEIVRSLEGFAGPGLMLPEQVWDAADIPAKGLYFGRATGSASPLGWAHAEYLELLVTIALAGFPDIVLPARRRYTEGTAPEPAFVWTHRHQITKLAPGRRLRVQLPRPGSIHYSFDDWKTFAEVEAIDTTLGVWVAEVPSNKLAAGTAFSWTAHYMTGWEGKNYTLTVG